MSKLIPVKFRKTYPPYNPGEIAGFDADTVDSLVTAGIAVRYTPSAAEVVQAVKEEGQPRSRRVAGRVTDGGTDGGAEKPEKPGKAKADPGAK